MARPPTIVFSGGGTGGHLFPGIAVARELVEREPAARIVFVGSERGLEAEIVTREGYEHRPLPVVPSTVLRRNPLRFAWGNWRALRLARRMIAELAPSAVVGLGGFASVPVVLAASKAGVRCVLLEQNIVPGRATRWLSRRATLICLSLAETAAGLPRGSHTYVTGNPVRREIAALARGTRADGASGRELLVLGGSQGAVAVNRAVLAAVASLGGEFGDWRIIHQTGRQDEDEIRRRYAELNIAATVSAFFDDLAERYARATLAVSRAGATTMAELACAGVPAILVPYPNSVRDHQRLNARAFEAAGAARVIEQNDAATTARDIASLLRTLAADAARLAHMSEAMRALARPNAARDVADCVMTRLAPPQ